MHSTLVFKFIDCIIVVMADQIPKLLKPMKTADVF